MSRFATEQAKAEKYGPLGLYLHVPFCASACDFCAFYQTTPTANAVEMFLTTMEREAEMVNWSRPVTTIFWGGGTPGLLAPDDLRRLGALVRKRCGGLDPEEWSVELAPASVTEARLIALKEIGVTRVSMGVQSFQPSLLDALGRQHTVEQVLRAHDRIRAADFQSVNLDLMFALPGQTAEEWAADVNAAVALAPDHLSTYCLTFEEDTALWIKLSQGRVKLDPEKEAQLYEATWAQLAGAGFRQYEVSNFARPGQECRHNLNTWRMNEWVGLGPSAASQYDGVRGANIANLEEWTTRIERNERATEDRVALTPELLAEDALIFGLRMNEGVNLSLWQEHAPQAPWNMVTDLLDRLVGDGLAERNGAAVRLTDRGRLLADAVGAEVMGAFSVEPVSI